MSTVLGNYQTAQHAAYADGGAGAVGGVPNVAGAGNASGTATTGGASGAAGSSEAQATFSNSDPKKPRTTYGYMVVLVNPGGSGRVDLASGCYRTRFDDLAAQRERLVELVGGLRLSRASHTVRIEVVSGTLTVDAVGVVP